MRGDQLVPDLCRPGRNAVQTVVAHGYELLLKSAPATRVNVSKKSVGRRVLCTAWRLSAARYRFVPDWKLDSIMKGMWNAVECHNGPFPPRFGRTCQFDGIQKINRAVRAQAIIGALRDGNDDRLFANAVIEMRMFESSRPELRVVATQF